MSRAVARSSRTSRNDSKEYNKKDENATFLGGYHHDKERKKGKRMR